MMNDIEQRLTSALTARAELVTEESLGEPAGTPPERTRKWPTLVAAAATVVAIAGAIASSSLERTRHEQIGMPPPVETSTVAPESSSSTPPSDAINHGNPGSAPPATSPTGNATTVTKVPEAPPKCGGKTCKLVQRVNIGGDTLEVWAAGEENAHWQVRVRGAVLANGPKFDSYVANNALRCSVVAGRPVCLIYTYYLGDSDTSVGLAKEGNTWRYTGATFLTPFGVDRIDIRDLYENGSIEVVAVQSGNGDTTTPQWTAQVWRWNGSRLGCTPRVDAPEKLPGWPEVRPDVSTLAIANCW